MPTDAAPSTPEPPRKPATRSMIGEGAGPTRPSHGVDADPVSAGARAQRMRGTLKVRQDAEALLAEASQLRQRAVADADAIVADAEAVSGELVYEARNTAQQIVAEAQERAEGIVARARAESEEMRAEIALERDRIRAAVADAVRDDIERAHGGLERVAPALEGALESISGALAALEVLRGDDWTPRRVLESVGPATGVAAVDPEGEAAPDAGEDAEAGGAVAGLEQVGRTDDGAAPVVAVGEARPLGWLFRAHQD